MTISLKLRGTSIVFFIRNGNTQSTLSTGKRCMPDNFYGKFDAKTGTLVAVTKNEPGHIMTNNHVNALYTRMQSCLANLQAIGQAGISASDFVEYVNGEKKPVVNNRRGLFLDTYKALIQLKTKKNTIELYDYAVTKVSEYTNIRTLRLADIDHAWLTSFDAWMISNGISDGTRGIVFRNIRSIMNLAVRNKELDPYAYQFGSNGFRIPSGKAAKFVLPWDSLAALYNLETTPGTTREVAKDLFFFTLFAGGINPVDVFHGLRRVDDHLEYVRQKTANKNTYPVKICITDYMQRFLEKYAGKHHLLRFCEGRLDYDHWYQGIRQELYRVGKLLGIENLRLYDARYAFSSFASRKAVGVDSLVVDMSLGHVPAGVSAKFYIIYDWENTYDAQRKVETYTLDNIRAQAHA